MAPKETTMRGISGRQAVVSWRYDQCASSDEARFGMIATMVQYFPVHRGRVAPAINNDEADDLIVPHWWAFDHHYHRIDMANDTIVINRPNVLIVARGNCMVRVNRRTRNVAVYTNSVWHAEAWLRDIHNA